LNQADGCEVVRVLPDGSVVLRRGEAELVARIHGLDVPVPPPSLYVDMVGGRLAGAGRSLRCVVVSGASRATVRLSYLAWRDKSGDVWKDVGLTLLEQGAAMAAPEDFAERQEYLRAEEAARRRGAGIWQQGPG
jgi:hypothetical protein